MGEGRRVCTLAYVECSVADGRERENKKRDKKIRRVPGQKQVGVKREENEDYEIQERLKKIKESKLERRKN